MEAARRARGAGNGNAVRDFRESELGVCDLVVFLVVLVTLEPVIPAILFLDYVNVRVIVAIETPGKRIVALVGSSLARAASREKKDEKSCYLAIFYVLHVGSS